MRFFAIRHKPTGSLLCPTKGEGITYSRFLDKEVVPILYVRKSSASSALTRWLGGKRYMGMIVCDGSTESRLRSECEIVEYKLVEVANGKTS